MTLQALKKIMVLIEINTCNCIGGVMVSGLASSAVDHGFKP